VDIKVCGVLERITIKSMPTHADLYFVVSIYRWQIPQERSTRDLISGILVRVRRLFYLGTALRVLTCALLTLGTAYLSGVLSLVLPCQFWCK